MLSDMSLPSSLTWYPSSVTWYPSIVTWYPCQDFYMQLQYMHTMIQQIICAEGLVGWWEVVPETCRQEWRHYTSECLPNLSFVEKMVPDSSFKSKLEHPDSSRVLVPNFHANGPASQCQPKLPNCHIKVVAFGCALGKPSGCQETPTTNHGKRSESIEVPWYADNHTQKTKKYSGRISPMQQFSIPKAQAQNQKFVWLTFIIWVGKYTVGPWMLMMYETNSMNKNVIPHGPQFIIHWYETVHQHLQAL